MKNDNKVVGIFTHDFYPIIGGQGRHVFEIYKQSLDQKKYKILVFSPTNNSLKNHVQIYPESLKSKLKNIEFSFKLNNSIEKIIKLYKLDLIHIHGGPGGVFLFKKASVPMIYTCHHTYWQQSHYIKQQKWKVIFYYLERIGYRNADKVICVSQDTLNVLKEKYDISSSKLVYIPNGINPISFTPNKIKSNKTLELLYVGRIDKRKGVEFLVKTMILLKNMRHVRLHIVGEGKDRIKLQEYSEINNLNVIFHGKLSDEDLNNLYHQINIQIVPSIFEGFGITILEGMARKIPVIGTNVDGIRGLIENNKNGILINYNDKEELVDKIKLLNNSPELCESLVKNALEKLNNFQWKKIYKNTISQYENFI